MHVRFLAGATVSPMAPIEDIVALLLMSDVTRLLCNAVAWLCENVTGSHLFGCVLIFTLWWRLAGGRFGPP